MGIQICVCAEEHEEKPTRLDGAFYLRRQTIRALSVS